jgi:multidrug resistance efflux pump
VRLLILLACVACAFIPYHHEVGGKCRILPLAARGVRAQIDDEIVQIHVNEGDWVEAGQLIANLAVRDEKAAVAMAEAELEKARANLQLVQIGVRPEAIAIAEKKVHMAQAQFELARSDLARMEQLEKENVAATQELERARKQYELAESGLAAAQEGLERVKSGAREEEVTVAAAEVSGIEARLAHTQQLVALGNIPAPIAGRVVTPNIREREGQYVHEGDLIAIIYDDSKLRVEVAADEQAAILVQPDMPVKIRLSGMDGRLVTGRVGMVSPSLMGDTEFDVERIRTDRETWTQEAVQDDEGLHTRIYVTLDDQGEQLRPGMTGYARIVVGSDWLWEALARPVVRFFRVEVWSWLP